MKLEDINAVAMVNKLTGAVVTVRKVSTPLTLYQVVVVVLERRPM